MSRHNFLKRWIYEKQEGKKPMLTPLRFTFVIEASMANLKTKHTYGWADNNGNWLHAPRDDDKIIFDKNILKI